MGKYVRLRIIRISILSLRSCHGKGGVEPTFAGLISFLLRITMRSFFFCRLDLPHSFVNKLTDLAVACLGDAAQCPTH